MVKLIAHLSLAIALIVCTCHVSAAGALSHILFGTLWSKFVASLEQKLILTQGITRADKSCKGCGPHISDTIFSYFQLESS